MFEYADLSLLRFQGDSHVGITLWLIFAAALPSEDLRAQMAARVSLGRIASADEIVGTALYVASDASSYMTGELIVLDGG
jgi:NAD(P)-dependent dehydrogenase (short-subunit alcohol dehydrogenase family)